MDIWKKIVGTINNYWQIGFNGPRIVNNSGDAEIRDSDGVTLKKLRVAAPADPNDAVTKAYLDTIEKFRIVSRQADCTSAIPNNTAVEGYVVVTTAGSGAVIGDLLYDNGENDSQAMQILSKIDGRIIDVTTSLTGGTVQFDADCGYQWDEINTLWKKIFDIGGLTGADRIIRYAINNTTPQDSIQKLPAGCRSTKSALIITTPFTAGITIEIGIPGTLNAFMLTTDNNPQAASGTMFVVEQDTVVASESVVRTTLAGTLSGGAGIVFVWYANANA